MNYMIKEILTIITVCLNSEKTISNTIESVLRQKEWIHEYIIVDGNSTDRTLEIVKKYEPLFEGRLKYISENDNGIYDAMNKGIKMASGDVVGIINSDDFYEQGCFEKVANNIPNTDKYIVYGMVRFWKNNQNFMTMIRYHNDINYAMMLHPGCFVSRSVYKEYGTYDASYKSAADYDFFLKLLKEDVCCVPVEEVLSNFSVDGISNSYVGYSETIDIQRKYKLISEAQYIKKKTILFVRKVLGVHRRLC